MDFDEQFVSAFEHLKIPAQISVGDRVDALVDPQNLAVPLEVKFRSLVTAADAQKMLGENSVGEAALFIVAQRVTAEARERLLADRGGFLDLRGHLGLRAPGILINTEVPAASAPRSPVDPFRGQVGLEVAVQVLLTPRERVAVRRIAREIGRSASSVSTVLAAFREHDWLGPNGDPDAQALFWEVAEVWPRNEVHLEVMPNSADQRLASALRWELEDISAAGWALTDTLAAAKYGAPVATSKHHAFEFYVPSEGAVRRAAALFGEVSSARLAKATVKAAPVPSVASTRVAPSGEGDAWPLAHPLFVALDLAGDRGRGREILEAWTLEGEWDRVW